MFAFITGGIVAGLITGHITKSLPKEQLDNFFTDMHRPVVGPEEITDDNM